MRLMSKEAISPAISEMAKPLEDRVGQDDAAPTTTASAVSSIGRKRTAPASTTASSKGMPSARRCSMKSTRMIELRTTMPAPAMKPIIEVAREERAHQPVRRQNAHQRKRNRRHHDQRREERAKPTDHQDEDQHQHRGKGGAEIAEHFDGDVPFAIPFHRRLVIGEGLGGIVDLERSRRCRRTRACRAPESLVHFQNRVNRTLHHARHVADDVGDRHQVLVVDALVHSGLLDFDQFAQAAPAGRRVGCWSARAARATPPAWCAWRAAVAGRCPHPPCRAGRGADPRLARRRRCAAFRKWFRR